MDCLLCFELETEPENGVQLCSPSWIEQNVQRIIETHLWPMTMFRTESQWLCSSCWHILQEFHKFYQRIECAHTDLNSRVVKSEYDLQESKDLNLFQPEIVLEQQTAFIKQECKETETDNDEDYMDDDDIPLINIRPSVDSSLGDPINESDPFMGDPLTKAERTTRSRSKRNPKSESNKPSKNIKRMVRVSDMDCKVKSDPDENEAKNDTSASSLLIATNDGDSAPLRYYYDSKMTIDEYDSFIAQHFKLICNKCQSSVMTFDELQQHFVDVHKKKQGYVVCCGTKFRDRGFLVDHINVHLNPEYFKCEYCPEVLTLRKSFKNHIKTHEKIYTCEMCDKKFLSKYLVNKHKLTHLPDEEKKFACDACEKCFASENLLTSHRQSKHEGITEPTLSCEVCGRFVGSKRSLSTHMKSIHPKDGKREYVCHICQKISPNQRALREHIRRVHASGYNHKCTICEKAFKRMDHLKDHMATHTGVGTSKCPWCPKVFNANSSMHLHRKKVHPKEWEEERRKRYSDKVPPNSKPSVVANSEIDAF